MQGRSSLQPVEVQLTERQQAVAEALARRCTIKEIAYDLQISESAVNKHIAALKARLGGRSLAEIVRAYTVLQGEHLPSGDGASEAGCRKPAGRFSHLAQQGSQGAEPLANSTSLLHLSDITPIFEPGEWDSLKHPRVVPRWLDGERPVLRRLLAVMVLVVLMLASVVVAAAAMQTVSELVGGTTRNLAMQR